MAKFGYLFDKVRIDPQFISEGEVQKFAQQELEVTAQRLVQANQQGKDADGSALKEYSASYKKAILAAVRPIKKGKNAGKLTGAKQTKGANKGKNRRLSKKAGNTSTTLHLTGDMHDGFGSKAKPIPFGAELRLPPAEATKAGYLEKLGFTNFFTIGKEDEERINANFEKFLSEKGENAITVKN